MSYVHTWTFSVTDECSISGTRTGWLRARGYSTEMGTSRACFIYSMDWLDDTIRDTRILMYMYRLQAQTLEVHKDIWYLRVCTLKVFCAVVRKCHLLSTHDSHVSHMITLLGEFGFWFCTCILSETHLYIVLTYTNTCLADVCVLCLKWDLTGVDMWYTININTNASVCIKWYLCYLMF